MPLDYARLTKNQKIAAFLIAIGPDAAAEVMSSFDNAQLEIITREIAAQPMIDSALREQVMKEFSGVISKGVQAVLGGVAFAQAALGKAKGEYAAAAILSRCEPEGPGAAGEEIQQMEGRQVLNLMKSEQPQTIAFIVSCMDTAKGAELVEMLAPEMREEVIERLGAMQPTSRENIHKIVANLNRRLDRRAAQQGLHRGGGVKACADLLNALDKEMRKTLLTKVEERDAALGAAIRKKVFSFEDLARLAAADLGRVMREVDAADLSLALKMAKPNVKQAVMKTMSKRAAAGLEEEIDMLGAARAKDVEAAQDRIIQIVRRLEEAEEITLDGGVEENANT